VSDHLTEAWAKLKVASGLALGWAADNAGTTEAWEVRIAAAEVVDLFQQVAMRRATDDPQSRNLPSRSVSHRRTGVNRCRFALCQTSHCSLFA
jgi:hypothetical protein